MTPRDAPAAALATVDPPPRFERSATATQGPGSQLRNECG
eukprot:CAMPEP_0176169428 /NCGR_PEP_ID=MMETSP0120_2-20121206/86728_1 /TAXON_ID=160619 /ORGANISM="Kryptoperidinium foliaceum, Strain CCMP 1326" /LENGTH=39 /DNA_ID= /DNA_START= /DNA_END= /DNA_ORIENTATION=